MKDERGIYYHPNPRERAVRMYVRERYGDVEFRLWNRDHPRIWEGHDWIAYDDIRAAAAEYSKRGTGVDPMEMYDLEVAKRLLLDEG